MLHEYGIPKVFVLMEHSQFKILVFTCKKCHGLRQNLCLKTDFDRDLLYAVVFEA